MNAASGTALDTNWPSTVSPQRYGFIGIGVMGWGMASNLRAKLPPDATLVVCEINKERLDQWLKTAPGPVIVATTPKEVAEQSVRLQKDEKEKVLISNITVLLEPSAVCHVC